MITKQQRSKWIKRARDAKCEGIIITQDEDGVIAPYHVQYRHQMNESNCYLTEVLEEEILEEIYI